MSTETITIAPRFRGPARSGNGGYTAGRVAGQVPGGAAVGRTLEVTLRLPPPLATAMSLRTDGATTLLEHAGSVVAEARAVDRALTPVAAVSPEAAEAAEAGFPGLRDHPFPTCFVCGTDRDEGDGLRIFPGPAGGGTVASVWVPDPALAEGDGQLDPAFAWAALDCIGGWAGDMEGRRMVLGRMSARVDRLPMAGRPHVVVGGARGAEGRKTFTASTLYDAEGRIVGCAEHTWIAVDPALFN